MNERIEERGPRIIVALDFAEQAQALTLVDSLDPTLCRLKVGKEMFTRFGPDFVRALQGRGFEVFLDLKFHDIPNTASAAVQAAADLGVWMVNVHASGGQTMMAACREKLEPYGSDRPLLIAVTVLTSMSADDLASLGISETPKEHVSRLASMTYNAGLDGVVCSAQEASVLRSEQGDRFRLVTPGIRPTFAAAGDQERIMTPSDAVRAGSDYLVIGRPITQANDPLSTLEEIQAEIQLAEE